MHYRSLLLIPLTLVMVLIPLSFISMEDNAYFWDLSGYWNYFIDFYTSFSLDPFSALKNLSRSIREDDYNLLPIVFPSVFNILPLSQRLSYILSLVICYFIPLILLLNIFFKDIGVARKSIHYTFISIFYILFVPFWAPILRGYPDIIGVIFVLLAVMLTIRTNLLVNIQWKKVIILGLLLWMPFVLRRWYAYTIVSLYLSLPLLNLFLYKNNKTSIKNIFKVLFNFLISGLVSIILALFFQYDLIIRVINSDYSSMYSAYQTELYQSVKFLINNVGYVIFYPFLCFLFLCNSENRKYIVFFVFNLFFSFWLFTRTQQPGIQHNLPFSMWISFVFIFGMISVLNKLNNSRILLYGFLLFLITILFSSLNYSLFNKKYLMNQYYSPIRTLPLKVDNYDNYVKLSSFLENLAHKGNQKNRITIYSSSGNLNGDMFDTISNRRLREYITPTKDVDLRDLINIDGLTSRYVIVTSPVQTHLPEASQQIVSIPVSSIINGTDIGKAYRKVENGEFLLSSGTIAYIYEKYRPFKNDEIREYMSKFYKNYPDWKKLYDKDSFIFYLSSLAMLGDIWGDYSYSDGKIFIHPGETTSTDIIWDFMPYSGLTISSFNTTCNTLDPVKVNIYNSSYNRSLFIHKGSRVSVSLNDFNGRWMGLSVDKNQTSYCDSLELIFN